MTVPILEKVGSVVDPSPPVVAESVIHPAAMDRPDPDGTDIREMSYEERFQVAQSLAEAFEDDPHFSYMLRDKEKRLARLGQGILSFMEHDWLANGIIHVNDQLSGAAIWTEPNKWQAGIAAQARILRALTGAVTPAEVARLSYVLGFVEDKHRQIERYIGPHYYLAMVGITPQWQSRGWGDALLKPMLERCDEEGAVAYLESSTTRSVPLYERNGFEVVAVGRYRGGTEPLHFMQRQPR